MSLLESRDHELSSASHVEDSSTLPFNAEQTYANITSYLELNIEKGFSHLNEQVWECCRRNYFAVDVSFRPTPCISKPPLDLNQGDEKSQKRIHSMAVSLSAADRATGRSVELIQYPSIRDKSTQLLGKNMPLAPSSPDKGQNHVVHTVDENYQSTNFTASQLPQQDTSDLPQQHSSNAHESHNFRRTFERVQSKAAISNNRKTSSKQQLFHLVVEVWAHIGAQGRTLQAGSK